jgi:hypothetical protein
MSRLTGGALFNVDQRALDRSFSNLEKTQIPFATMTALNDIAFGLHTDLVEEMKRVFDRPNPFTLNAFYVKRATKRDLSAWVGIRDFAGKGTPAWKYLTPQTDGGERAMKRMEKRLSAISGGQFVLPGRGARLDQYGNISRGQIGQVLSRLNAMADPAQNMTDKTTQRLRRKGLIARGQRSDYFVAHSKRGNKRPIGVYQLLGPGKVEPVLLFSQKPPTYRARFHFDDLVLSSINKHSVGAFERAMARALATAK